MFFNSLEYIYQGMGLMDHMINSILIFLSPCLFNLYAENIMQNAGLDEAQAGVKIARRNIKSLRYADNTTLMRESREELKNFLMNVKE